MLFDSALHGASGRQAMLLPSLAWSLSKSLEQHRRVGMPFADFFLLSVGLAACWARVHREAFFQS
jgi:hypothetical protein